VLRKGKNILLLIWQIYVIGMLHLSYFSNGLNFEDGILPVVHVKSFFFIFFLSQSDDMLKYA